MKVNQKNYNNNENKYNYLEILYKLSYKKSYFNLIH